MTTRETREPAVSGVFYPGEAKELRNMVEDFLEVAPTLKVIPKALIAPHAGYIYSGRTAGAAYALLRQPSVSVQRVVIVGPAHHIPVRRLGVSRAAYFRTPLGSVPVDQDGIDTALQTGLVEISEEAHTPEHSLEVQLPFLQLVLKDFSIVPLLTGRIEPADLATVLEALFGPETLIVASSDLSHYHTQTEAEQIDAATTGALEQLNWSAISDLQACGATGIRGLLSYASKHHLRCTTICLNTSAETSGDYERVVGYGAYVFH